MPQADAPLPDDPETLKALLIAERARSERLVQIIKEMQRHRFGRRAETLPEDQMLLALEEAEQTEAGAAAEEEARSTQVRAEAARRDDAGAHERAGWPVGCHVRSGFPATLPGDPLLAAAGGCFRPGSFLCLGLLPGARGLPRELGGDGFP